MESLFTLHQMMGDPQCQTGIEALESVVKTFVNIAWQNHPARHVNACLAGFTQPAEA